MEVEMKAPLKRNHKLSSVSTVKPKEPLPVGDGINKQQSEGSPIKKKKVRKHKKAKTIPVSSASINEQYPILNNEEIIQQFMKVPLSNNQKGRIRQAVKESLRGTSNELVPSIIHGKINEILKSSENLTESQLRRIRILYNLLKTSLKESIVDDADSPIQKEKTAVGKTGDGIYKNVKKPVQKKEKRYVVFLGNLPLDITEEQILGHFCEMNEQIKDIRIPKQTGRKKSAFAYVELTNEPSYEFALSKHHSMLGKRRITVLYTTQKNGRITKGEAKSKTAKLIAMQKSGMLLGSMPLKKKRSQRRLKQKLAQSKEVPV